MAEKERGVRWRCYLCPSLFHWLFLGFVSGCVFVFVFVVVVVIVFVIVFFIVINLSLSSILPFELQRRLGSNDGRERKRSSLTLPSLSLSLSLSFIKCHCRCHCHQFVIAAESNWSGVQLGPMMAEKEIADSQNPTFPPSAPLCWIFSKSICQSKKKSKVFSNQRICQKYFFPSTVRLQPFHRQLHFDGFELKFSKVNLPKVYISKNDLSTVLTQTQT